MTWHMLNPHQKKQKPRYADSKKLAWKNNLNLEHNKLTYMNNGIIKQKQTKSKKIPNRRTIPYNPIKADKLCKN